MKKKSAKSNAKTALQTGTQTHRQMDGWTGILTDKSTDRLRNRWIGRHMSLWADRAEFVGPSCRAVV